ncbi:META domain-containing protein [Streptomyces sp. NPDC004726]
MRTHLSVPVTVLALLTLAACGSQTVSEAGSGRETPADLPITDDQWTVTGMTVGGKRTEAPAGAMLHFPAEGRIQGNYGCNRFGADAELDGDVLVVKADETTEMGCPEAVQSFENSMKATLTGRLKAQLSGDEKKLTLTDPTDGDTITLAVQPAAPLLGTKWTVNSLIRGDQSASAPAGAENVAYLVFGKDGSVRGNLGCNTFTATAKVSGPKILLGRIASTKMFCGGGKGQVEAHMLKVLDREVTYVVQHRGLTLTGPGDARVGAIAEK